MKTTLLVLYLLLTSSAFGQNAGSISGQPQPYHPTGNPAHASVQPLAQEQYVLSGTHYSSAQGEKATWELPQAPVVPLGDIARMLKKDHARLKKARVVYEN